MRLFLTLYVCLAASTLAAGNRLAGENSLYLQQHAEQPVDWLPWGDAALAKARAEDKPIFVSVGYAACHWCHVMSEESFDDEAIAALLNESFVAIKIDRERRPDLDAQFGMVTTLLEGSSGWPNSVFLTPDGEPFHAGGYFPPDVFSGLLEEVANGWKTNRAPIVAYAFETAALMRNYLDQASVLGEVSQEDITDAALAAIGDLDEFNGGFGNAPKFPREVFLLFILDQAQRTGNEALLNAVTLTLDGMLSGGVHDHIGGGFHRYATDPAWQVPHFEKMLYNQALMGRVLLRAYALTGRETYARGAKRTIDYVLRDLRADGGAFFAAEDASSLNEDGERKEGWFYTWDRTEVGPVIAGILGLEEEGEFEGRSVALPPSPEFHENDLYKLRVLRDARPRPIRDEKIILSWNAEMISTLAEASAVLQNPAYLERAVTAAGYLEDELRSAEGLRRIVYEGRADSAAQLTDYAAYGDAMLALYDYGGDEAWLARAEELVSELSRFADDGQAMRLTQMATGLGVFRPLDDTELASGNALALQLLAGVDRRQARTGEAAQALSAAVAIDGINRPRRRAGLLTALETSRSGPSGPLRVSSGGAVHVLALADRAAGVLKLEVRIKDGWHINAHRPLDDYLIGMALEVDGVSLPASAFPASATVSLGFSDAPLALYEAGFSISAPLGYERVGPSKATLTLQACSDEVCLPPDDMVFYLWSERADDGG